MSEDMSGAPGADIGRLAYAWDSHGPGHHHAYLIPELARILDTSPGGRLLDLGCGNGSLTARLHSRGFDVVGLEGSKAGVELARAAHPNLSFDVHDLEEPLPSALHHTFDVVLSAEVIEHLNLPRELFRRAAEALKPGGILIVSTPYHGWAKNVLLALTSRMDVHWTVGWDHGHIKFFVATLKAMAGECGFTPSLLRRVGRVPPLAKSMILVARLDDDGLSNGVPR